MLNFDSLVATIISNTVEALITFVNVYLIVVIVKCSPKTMGSFRIYLVKLAATDFIFSFSLGWLFLPNLLFPLPAVTCGGLFKYFGEAGLKIAWIFTLCSGEITLLSVNDCCLYRMFVFYKFDRALERFAGVPGIIFFVCFNGFACIAVTIGAIINTAGYEDIVNYAHRHNLTDYLENLPPSTALMAFPADDVLNLLGGLLIILWLLGTEGFNVGLSGAVLYKVHQSKSSMSKDTYKLQKSLTYVLLAQATIPFLSVTGPMSFYIIALMTRWNSLFERAWLQYMTAAMIGCYPLVNSIFCLYCMKPYRIFTTQLLKKAFCFWRKDVTNVVEIARLDATSSNLA